METVAAPLPRLMLHDDVNRALIYPRSITKTWLEKLQRQISQGELRDVSDLFIDEC
jgi:hypothetical protein